MHNAAAVFAGALALTGLASCTVNPVTGESEFTLMSPAEEVSVGQAQYLPTQQSQGGAYNLDPALNRYVTEVGNKLAAQSDRPGLPYEFVVLNNDTANAWALPGGKIAINRGLLYLLEDEAQLAAVLGHEIVHVTARHAAQKYTQSVLLGVGGQLLVGVGSAYGVGDLAQQGTSLGSAFVAAQYGQGQELQSDRVGMEYMSRVGYEPLGAVELQQAFVKLSEGSQSGPFDRFFRSHPPSEARVSANLERARELPSGDRNRAAYQAATSKIRQDKPAYDLHQQALALANKNQLSEAQAKVEQALQIENKESLFWNTLGRLQLSLKQPDQALKSLDKAVALNNQYFANHLYRGLVTLEQKNYSGAQKDLTRANQLLGTQIGAYYLAQAELGLGNKSQAIQLLQAVQQAGGELGTAAGKQLNTLTGQP